MLPTNLIEPVQCYERHSTIIDYIKLHNVRGTKTLAGETEGKRGRDSYQTAQIETNQYIRVR